MSSIADVVNGKLNISESSQETERKVGSELGKEEFLQLLVTQMKYQDPLEPTDNTEYVSQLAQFSELEQMQNLNSTTSNTSAFTLLGKEVYIEDQSEAGDVTKVQGTVEYVSIQNGKAYVSVDGTLYKYDSIVKVLDDNYVISNNIPSVQKQALTYRHHDPQDVTVEGISLGSHGYEATSFAVALVSSSGDTKAVDSKYLSYKDGRLTISKDAFSQKDAGIYTVAFVFDDANKTIISDKVTIEVKGIKPDNSDKTENSDSNT